MSEEHDDMAPRQERGEDDVLDWRVTLFYSSGDFSRRVTWEGTILQTTRAEALRIARGHAGVSVTESGGRVTWVTPTNPSAILAPESATERVIELRESLSTNVFAGDDPQPMHPDCDNFDEAAREIGELAEPPDVYVRI